MDFTTNNINFWIIGFADDYKKIKNNSSYGISSKIRIFFKYFWFINNIFNHNKH